MTLSAPFQLLASYNQWMNQKLYEAAGTLSAEAIAEDRGAFFGSILGTLNHLVVADRLWLKRFAAQPAIGASLQTVAALPDPVGLDQTLFDSLPALSEHRRWLDEQILRWVASLSETDLEQTVHYHNTQGIAHQKRLSSLLLHFFNHQTHHRGQTTTLLSQAGVEVGVTDLLALIPEAV